jgi:hypothetical protein
MLGVPSHLGLYTGLEPIGAQVTIVSVARRRRNVMQMRSAGHQSFCSDFRDGTLLERSSLDLSTGS